MGWLVDLVTLPCRAVRGAVEAFRLWKRLQADADARICLAFKRQQEILSERLREAQASGDAAEEDRARQLLHRVQDNELSYHQSRMADLAAHVLADRAPSGAIGPDVPKLPEPERAVLESAATVLGALRPAQSAVEHLLRGNAFYAAERYEEALLEYSAALALLPDDPVTLYSRGTTLSGLGRHREALADYNRAHELRPDDPDTLNNRGNALGELDRHEEALADYNRSLELRPDHPATLNNRGATLHDLKRYEEALADFNRSLQLRPDHPATLYNRACALSLTSRYEEALRDVAEAIAGDGENRRLAREDEDFEGLRNDPQWGPKFRELVETKE
jgi:tetratricopeptide (TPR) repeat protein